MNHDQVIEYYVKKYGSQEPLASPIDRGFNRLAWMLPYVAGVVGIVLVGSAAIRWTCWWWAAGPAVHRSLSPSRAPASR
jgi:cytochrome c-type biogenesis protein CcmH/NrfF